MIRGVLVSIGVGVVAGAVLLFVGRLRRRSLEQRRLDGLGTVASHREEWPRDGY